MRIICVVCIGLKNNLYERSLTICIAYWQLSPSLPTSTSQIQTISRERLSDESDEYVWYIDIQGTSAVFIRLGSKASRSIMTLRRVNLTLRHGPMIAAYLHYPMKIDNLIQKWQNKKIQSPPFRHLGWKDSDLERNKYNLANFLTPSVWDKW